MATMAMRWVMSNTAITAPIVGASKPEQLADSFAAAEQGALPADLKARLDEITARMAGGRRRTLMPARLARQRPVRELAP